MDRPKVSVIIPIYNAEKYLRECLESVRRQTLKDIEVICVDDGSTDDTPRIIKDFIDRDPRFRVIYKPNSGYGDSMNRGISAAKGEYIGIVESDDFIVEEMYESLYDLSEDGTADIVKGNFWDCYDQPDGTIKKVENKERESMPDTEDAFTLREHREILLGHPSIWSAIYRREFLIDHDIHFETVKGGGWVDNPFFYETLFCAEKIKWTKKPYYCYRKTNEASSSIGYDFSIPFERMTEVFSLADKYEYNDKETLKYIYTRALNYLKGATGEPHYAGKEDYARPYIRRMLKMMDPDIISEQFSDEDQMLFWKYRSPIDEIMPSSAKILIYDRVPFDNPDNSYRESSLYCHDIIGAFLRYRPDVQVYFLSSSTAHDTSKDKCYFRSTVNVFGKRCRSFEIVNSPVSFLRGGLSEKENDSVGNEELKKVFSGFLQKFGPFKAVYFNSPDGLSSDVFELSKELPDTRFIYYMHDYTAICVAGQSEEITDQLKNAINKYMDGVLVGSEHMRMIAKENGILPNLLRVCYIGTAGADHQIRHSTAQTGEYFKIAWQVSDPDDIKSGFGFLTDAVEKMDPSDAADIDILVLTESADRDKELREKLRNLHSVEIIHEYTSDALPQILQEVELGIIPVLWEENLTYEAAEMVSLGIPLLCSDAGGASELCEDEMFRFKTGDTGDFINKLLYFAGHRDEARKYWESYRGLVTLEQHCDELCRIFKLPAPQEDVIDPGDYADLLAENEFLYQHFQTEEDMSLSEEVKQLTAQRDFLQYTIDETRKSKSYRWGLMLTAVPRKIRSIFRGE